MVSLESFLSSFVPLVAKKSRQLQQARWLLDTTGSRDAAQLQQDFKVELASFYQNPTLYPQLLHWSKDPLVTDPLLKRQLSVLIRTCKQYLIPQELIEEISEKETALATSYANFRPLFDGKLISENQLRSILKQEENPEKRKIAWETSKQIGDHLAPQILSLVNLRNQAAQGLGYPDYFQMQLDLQEVNGEWLEKIFSDLEARSEKSYADVLDLIEEQQSERFHLPREQLGAWSWSDPFCQEDPLDTKELDSLVAEVDLCETTIAFYEKLGIDVRPIFLRSDMWERPGKNQHAFCTNIDREKDIRMLNNVQPSIKWLETVLHELGHAVYELGLNPSLPWLLREPSHTLTTEAMALIAGRQAYSIESLKLLLPEFSQNHKLMEKASESLIRRQLIFSRWAIVMTQFEKELYRDPLQDLNDCWWTIVETHQKIKRPPHREDHSDWAAKCHIALAPVYYFSYLLGELFASSIEETLQGKSPFASKETGSFLQERLFFPGNQMHWNDLVSHVTGRPLSPDSWLNQFT